MYGTEPGLPLVLVHFGALHPPPKQNQSFFEFSRRGICSKAMNKSPRGISHIKTKSCPNFTSIC
jgi:hypothetical protein